MASILMFISIISYLLGDVNGAIQYGIMALFIELDSLKHKIVEKK